MLGVGACPTPAPRESALSAFLRCLLYGAARGPVAQAHLRPSSAQCCLHSPFLKLAPSRRASMCIWHAGTWSGWPGAPLRGCFVHDFLLLLNRGSGSRLATLQRGICSQPPPRAGPTLASSRPRVGDSELCDPNLSLTPSLSPGRSAGAHSRGHRSNLTNRTAQRHSTPLAGGRFVPAKS